MRRCQADGRDPQVGEDVADPAQQLQRPGDDTERPVQRHDQDEPDHGQDDRGVTAPAGRRPIGPPGQAEQAGQGDNRARACRAAPGTRGNESPARHRARARARREPPRSPRRTAAAARSASADGRSRHNAQSPKSRVPRSPKTSPYRTPKTIDQAAPRSNTRTRPAISACPRRAKPASDWRTIASTSSSAP